MKNPQRALDYVTDAFSAELLQLALSLSLALEDHLETKRLEEAVTMHDALRGRAPSSRCCTCSSTPSSWS